MIDIPQANFYLPTVIEHTRGGERAYDIYSRLLMDRIVFLGTQVNDVVSNAVIAQMLFLESQDPEKDIYLYINSPGGVITAGMAIYDTIQYIRPDVATICMGQAASMGAVLLAAGAPGKRRALPHARVLIHQPHGGAQGQATDIEIHAREIVRLKDVLCKILVEHTGQNMERVRGDSDRDFFMTTEEALEYGIIDRIVTTRDNEE